jgi:hypothetical protein
VLAKAARQALDRRPVPVLVLVLVQERPPEPALPLALELVPQPEPVLAQRGTLQRSVLVPAGALRLEWMRGPEPEWSREPVRLAVPAPESVSRLAPALVPGSVQEPAPRQVQAPATVQ